MQAGRLFLVDTGVYAVGRPPRTRSSGRQPRSLRAAQGPLYRTPRPSPYGASRRSGAPLRGRRAGDRRPRGIRSHRVRNLHRRDITTQLGLRTTTLARALLDTAPRLTHTRLTRAVNDGLHSSFMFPAHLVDIVERNPNHRGTQLLAPFIADTARGVTRSELEDMFLAFCKRHGLPTPLTNVASAATPSTPSSPTTA